MCWWLQFKYTNTWCISAVKPRSLVKCQQFGIINFSIKAFISTSFLCLQLFSSVIRQKANLKTEVTRKQNTPRFPKKPKHFLLSDTHMYLCVSRDKRCLFFGKFDVFYFLYLLFWDSPFCLIHVLRLTFSMRLDSHALPLLN